MPHFMNLKCNLCVSRAIRISKQGKNIIQSALQKDTDSSVEGWVEEAVIGGEGSIRRGFQLSKEKRISLS